MSPQEQAALKLMSEDKRIAENLIDSLFPNIYGNDEVLFIFYFADSTAQIEDTSDLQCSSHSG